jgi:hypothetical protein
MFNLTHPVLRDGSGAVSVAYIPNQGGYIYFPHNAIVDQNHVLRYSVTGFDDNEMRTTLNSLMTPQIVVSPNHLEFGTVIQGGSENRTILIDNTGMGIVNISSMVASNPSFHITPSTGQVYAYSDSLVVTVTFNPSQARPYSDSLMITSTGGNSIVRLSGTGEATEVQYLTVRRILQHIALSWNPVPGVWRYHVYASPSPNVTPIPSNFKAVVANPSYLDVNANSLSGPRARFYCVTAVFQP